MFEVSRYNFNYSIDKREHTYSLPDNKEILKNGQEFYDIRVNYRDNVLYKNIWYGNKSRPYINIDNVLSKQFIATNNILNIHFADTFYKNHKNDYLVGKDNLRDKCKNKYDFIKANLFKYDDIKNLNIQERIEYQFKPTIIKILTIFECLNKNGGIMFNLFGFDSNTIKLISLLLLLFERIIIYHGWVVCLDYNQIISKDKFKELIDNIEYVKIDETIDLNNLSHHILDSSKMYLNIIKSIANKDFELYFNIVDKLFFNQYIEFQYAQNNDDIDYDFEKQLYEKLKSTSVSIQENTNINSSIKPVEGNFLYNIIHEHKLKRCLEVGMAYGISSMYILLGLKKLKKDDIKLDSIDPFQETQWNNFGVKLVKKIKMDKYHKLYEDKSYIVLPKLLEKKNEYDLIFIDGWHTFDYTLLDFFYANLLLRKGGIIVIDDAYHQGVNKCLKYLDSNYKNYKRIKSPPTVGAYEKIGDDNREWSFHTNF